MKNFWRTFTKMPGWYLAIISLACFLGMAINSYIGIGLADPLEQTKNSIVSLWLFIFGLWFSRQWDIVLLRKHIDGLTELLGSMVSVAATQILNQNAIIEGFNDKFPGSLTKKEDKLQ